MEPTSLQLTWFVLLGVLMAGYAILDGFDLGVGILHLFARTETERRVFMSSIGPIWDGNEVWLVVLGGATLDRKSTRLNSSHTVISYAVFCLKKKKKEY